MLKNNHIFVTGIRVLSTNGLSDDNLLDIENLHRQHVPVILIGQTRVHELGQVHRQMVCHPQMGYRSLVLGRTIFEETRPVLYQHFPCFCKGFSPKMDVVGYHLPCFDLRPVFFFSVVGRFPLSLFHELPRKRIRISLNSVLNFNLYWVV